MDDKNVLAKRRVLEGMARQDQDYVGQHDRPNTLKSALNGDPQNILTATNFARQQERMSNGERELRPILTRGINGLNAAVNPAFQITIDARFTLLQDITTWANAGDHSVSFVNPYNSYSIYSGPGVPAAGYIPLFVSARRIDFGSGLFELLNSAGAVLISGTYSNGALGNGMTLVNAPINQFNAVRVTLSAGGYVTFNIYAPEFSIFSFAPNFATEASIPLLEYYTAGVAIP